MVTLNVVKRQGSGSGVLYNANEILAGHTIHTVKVNESGVKDNAYIYKADDPVAARQSIVSMVTAMGRRGYRLKDIQVLCPTKMGPCGTQALNPLLQDLLNPPARDKAQLQSASRVFRVGDKVMQVRNNYEIIWRRDGGEQGVGAYNGDIGIVESIDTRSRSMVVHMDDRRLVYPAENLNELEPAYAITVHKSQGSEFAAVVLPAAGVPPRLCYRNLFYTGVTRARRLCVVAGRRDTVAAMMANVRQNLRYSGLAALLQQRLAPKGP